MQSLIVLASLVFELAGSQNDSPPPQSLTLQKKHLSPLRVKTFRERNINVNIFRICDILVGFTGFSCNKAR